LLCLQVKNFHMPVWSSPGSYCNPLACVWGCRSESVHTRWGYSLWLCRNPPGQVRVSSYRKRLGNTEHI
jgi:hypothetical protein